MLQRIHDSFGRWVAVVVLGLISVGFIFWGVDFGLGVTTFAAKVNGENLPLSEFEPLSTHHRRGPKQRVEW
jgi:hypothetical protein